MLGLVGIFLPVLPTTPFLLLAAYCYLRGSARLHNALLRNRFAGSYIRNYLEGKGMTPRMKAGTLLALWVSLLLSIFLLAESLPLKLVLAVILIAVTIHILMLKTCRSASPR